MRFRTIAILNLVVEIIGISFRTTIVSGSAPFGIAIALLTRASYIGLMPCRNQDNIPDLH